MEKKFSDIYNSEKNFISILLFLSAIGILIFHSYPLYYGANGKKDIITNFFITYDLGKIIVATFFITSGFLITQSILNSKKRFIFKRFFRIFPSYIFMLLFVALIIYPVLTHSNFINYLKEGTLYKDFIFKNISIVLPGKANIGTLFVDNPYPLAIIGSTWTLKHTIFTYILIYIINKLGILKKGHGILIIYGIFAFLYLGNQLGFLSETINAIKSSYYYISFFAEFNNLIELVLCFLSGVIFYLYKDSINYSFKIFITLIILFILSKYLFILNFTAVFILPYIVLYIGIINKSKPSKLLGNLSYSVFLYGFTVQQIIIYYNNTMHISIYIILSIILSVALSLIIYFIIDKPSEKLSSYILKRMN